MTLNEMQNTGKYFYLIRIVTFSHRVVTVKAPEYFPSAFLHIHHCDYQTAS